jgi:hypothetical protein
MVLAVEAGHRMDKKGVIKWLFLTVIGGAFFVGSQAWEWSHFIHGGGGYITTSTTAPSTGCTTTPMIPMTRPTHRASTWCRPTRRATT